MTPIYNPELIQKGFLLTDFPLSEEVKIFVEKEQWKELDEYFLAISKQNGTLRNFLSTYLKFEKLEHIIARRSAPDDDGIWHDDGSRFLGFSLSLNLHPEQIKGGELLFKRKEETHTQIFPPQPYGKIILFLSGLYGHEHKVNEVTEGVRLVIAGWCS